MIAQYVGRANRYVGGYESNYDCTYCTIIIIAFITILWLRNHISNIDIFKEAIESQSPEQALTKIH